MRIIKSIVDMSLIVTALTLSGQAPASKPPRFDDFKAASGRLFGGADDIFALTSNEEHAYNVETQIWFLPRRGNPKLILDLPAVGEKFLPLSKGSSPGIWLWKETYHGVNSATKGRKREFWTRNSMQKTLTLYTMSTVR